MAHTTRAAKKEQLIKLIRSKSEWMGFHGTSTNKNECGLMARRLILKEGSHSPSTGLTECNLLITAASHVDCQADSRDLLIRPLKD